MTVLITGAGRVGTHTARALLDQGVGVLLYDPDPNLAYIERVVGKDRKLFRVERGDVRDLARIVDLMMRIGVTRILHTAGMRGARANENPSLAFHTNVTGTLNLIEAARIRSLSRIVVVGSAVPYGPTAGVSGFGPALDSEGMGAAYHAMSELLALAYQRLQGVNAIICRCCLTYGQGRHDGELADDAVIDQLVRRALQANGGGTVDVDFPAAERVYVKDLALGIREAIFVEKPTTRSYDLGSGEIVDAAMMATALADLVPGLTTRPSEPPDEHPATLDISRAHEDLGYSPQWIFTQALRDYVEEIRLESSKP